MNRFALALVATVCLSQNLFAQYVGPITTGNCSPVNVALQVNVTKPDHHYHYGVEPRFAAAVPPGFGYHHPTTAVAPVVTYVPVGYGAPAPIVGYVPPTTYAVTASACRGARIDPVVPAIGVPPFYPAVIHTPPVVLVPHLRARIDSSNLSILIHEGRKKITDQRERVWALDKGEEKIPHYITDGSVVLTGTTSEFDKKKYLTISWRIEGEMHSRSLVLVK